MTLYYVIPLVATLLNTFLFVVIIINRPWQRQHKFLLMYLASAASWGFSNFLLLNPFLIDQKLLLFKLVLVTSLWMAVQLYYFCMTFLGLPSGFGVKFGYGSLLLLTVLTIIGQGPSSLIFKDGSFTGPVYGWWFAIYIIPIVVLSILAVLFLIKRVRIIKDPAERNKIAYLFAAVIIIVFFGIISATPLTLAGGLPWGYIGALLSACILTYAVIKHELVSINSVIRRSLGLGLSVAVGIGAYTIIFYVLHLVTQIDFSFGTLILANVAGVFVALIIFWLRPYFMSIVDQVFYRETYVYRQILIRFDREMGNIISLDELAEKMLTSITKALRAGDAKLLFQNSDTDDFVTHYSYPKKKIGRDNQPRLKFDNPIISWLKKEINPLYISQLDHIPYFSGLWQAERELFVNLDMELLCPIKSRNQLVGILALGVKKGRSSYAQEDIEIIKSMAAKAGIIIENARMFNTLQQKQNQVQQLLTESIHAQEEERQRISIDLHDSVAQWLAGASYQAQTVEALLDSKDREKVREQIMLVEDTIERSLKELRRVVVDLRPPALDELGLAHSLKQSMAVLSSEGISCGFKEEGEPVRLPDSVEITVYRVVQEAITNIRKHAEASRVDLGLEFRDDTLIVKIQDNGKGFNLSSTIENALSVGNLGLLGMNKRVEMLGGQFEIKTREDGGTVVTMTLPTGSEIEESQDE